MPKRWPADDSCYRHPFHSVLAPFGQLHLDVTADLVSIANIVSNVNIHLPFTVTRPARYGYAGVSMRVSAVAKPIRQLPAWLVAIVLIVVAILSALPATGSDLPVTWRTLERQDSFQATRVYGGVTTPVRASDLGFKQGGEIAAVSVDIGDEVNAGSVIARLDTDSLQAARSNAAAEVDVAQARLRAVEAELDLANKTLARVQNLRRDGHVSIQALDEAVRSQAARQGDQGVARASLQRARAGLRLAEVALREATIRAPYDGRIQARHVDEGSQVGPGQPVLRLVETSRSEAHIGIPERTAGTLQPGTSHVLRWNGQRLSATLLSVLPEIDPATRTLTGVFRLSGDEVPFGAVVELELATTVAEPGYWVPLAALTESDRGLWAVYVLDGDSTVERRLVEVVHSEPTRAFVRGTLSDGDKLVTSDAARIVPGQRVNATEQIALNQSARGQRQ